jgi:hypothetical protein
MAGKTYYHLQDGSQNYCYHINGGSGISGIKVTTGKEIEYCPHCCIASVEPTPSYKGQYHLPIENDVQLAEIKYNESKVQLLMERMHFILPDIILNKDRLKMWRKCVTQFQTLYFKLRTHLDFTEVEVVLVKKQIDSFNGCWLEIAHKEGMTN